MKLNVGDIVSLKFKSINNYGYYMYGVTGDTKLTITHIDYDPMINGRMYICLTDGNRADISVTETAVHRIVKKFKSSKPKDKDGK